MGIPEIKKQKIKQLIRKLHDGADPQQVKSEFQEILKGTDVLDIAQIEEELIKEGMSKEEIMRLCDVHLAVFKESLEQAKPIAPPGHPIYILMEEHKLLLDYTNKLRETANQLNQVNEFSAASEPMQQVTHLIAHFKDSAKHYLREENVLFPYLEKHGITQPPAIMWQEHDQIREIEKALYQIVDNQPQVNYSEFVEKLGENARALADMLSSHFYKENNVLFPTALRVISMPEWPEIRTQFDEIGYCCFTPELAKSPISFAIPETGKPAAVSQPAAGSIKFTTGSLSPEELECILNSLPVDITFVDKNDEVKYFSNAKDRIFVRTTAVLGRNVKNCHPQKSLHVVNQILDEFKSGKRDSAVFWINLGGKLIYIRYFAVRNETGEYLGCLEVSQDITEIKKLEGEKRLL
ncbi:MAG: DUF438 domain-containing protein [bacterium]|nr:DUF438 domain-containing protein [bacterium]